MDNAVKRELIAQLKTQGPSRVEEAHTIVYAIDGRFSIVMTSKGLGDSEVFLVPEELKALATILTQTHNERVLH